MVHPMSPCTTQSLVVKPAAMRTWSPSTTFCNPPHSPTEWVGKPLPSSHLTVSQNDQDALSAMIGWPTYSALSDAASVWRPHPEASLLGFGRTLMLRALAVAVSTFRKPNQSRRAMGGFCSFDRHHSSALRSHYTVDSDTYIRGEEIGLSRL